MRVLLGILVIAKEEREWRVRDSQKEESRQLKRAANMSRTALLGSLLLLLQLPFSALGSEFHEIERRDAKNSHNWNYEDDTGPKNWPQMFKKCGGSRQSPIDIVNSEVDLNDELDAFEFDNYDDPLVHARIENNGHTVQVSPGTKDAPRTIDEGGMDDQYQFLQLHFHWGSDSKKGSEHLIDGQSFPLEMHFVHINKNYKSKQQALEKEDGLAVLGVLFKLDDEDNPALTPIIDKLDDVRQEGSKADLDDSFTLESLLPDDLMPYYRYKGSLTTPPCSEAVTWTVFKDFVPISEKQLQQFRNVKEEDEGEAPESLVNNFRPVQELHGRVIEISKDSDSGAATLVSSLMMIFTAFAIFL